MHPDSFYRRRLFNDFVRIIGVPSTSLFVILQLASIRLGYLTLPAYLAFAAACAYARLQYWDWTQTREATRLGARRIPQVSGKWPGNFDIYLKLLKAAHTTYLHSFQLSLFEEYQATTLNLRLLWQDVIITMDEKHIQFVLATGFSSFWRGPRQKERMYACDMLSF